MTTTKTTTDPMTLILPGGVELVMVAIPGKDYWMGKFPVTQTQWEAVTGANPSEFQGAENPVEQISWDDCQAFLKKINVLPAVQAYGLVFRLPTEDEWRFSARAGATGNYCRLADGRGITSETINEVAWFDELSDHYYGVPPTPFDDSLYDMMSKTQPVGKKQPNAFGLYDMYGNIWEWTVTADDAVAARLRLLNFDNATSIIVLGGSWYDRVYHGTRRLYSPSHRANNLGFRLCASGSVNSESDVLRSIP